MLRIIFDHDFNHGIRRGLTYRLPNLDFVTAHEVGLSSVHDRRLLSWAAENNRLLLTHDRRTMPEHFASILLAGERTAGILIIPQNMAIRRAVDELELFIVCENQEEWIDRIHIL